MVDQGRVELPTSCLQSRHSTTELLAPNYAKRIALSIANVNGSWYDTLDFFLCMKLFSAGMTLTTLVALATLVPLPSLAYHRPPVTVRILSSDGKELSKFNVPSQNQAGGVSLAVADLGTDGVPEIIVGSGVGNAPEVRVLRKDGSEIGKFLAYKSDMGTGINVAVCDLNGDGINEIITAPQRGGGPHIRVFDHKGTAIGEGVFVYAETFRGGVNLACGDLDGVAGAELVTLPAASGGPHVKVWKWDPSITASGGIPSEGGTGSGQLALHQEFFAFDSSLTNGLIGYVSQGALTVATERGKDVRMKRVRLASPLVMDSEQTETATGNGLTSAVPTTAGVFLAASSGGQILNLATKTTLKADVPFGSAAIASGDFDQDGTPELVVAPGRPLFSDKYPDTPKSIVVDLSEQRLYAYENGVLANTFLVSTGNRKYPTPQGDFSVLAKVWQVKYQWSYGPNHPDNYDLGLVKYNLRIRPHVYIHYAPWHKNFGHIMSHGCVNLSLESAKWIYEWAEENIPVTVQT